MTEEQQFAPQYSTRERVVRVIAVAIVGALIVFPCEWWFFPWLERFSATSPCYEILGVRGHVVLMYGLFVGMPLGIALIAGSFFFRYAYRILCDDQVPPIGQKVMGRMLIRRGRSARVRAYVIVGSVFLPVALAIWGAPQAAYIAGLFDPSEFDWSVCPRGESPAVGRSAALGS